MDLGPEQQTSYVREPTVVEKAARAGVRRALLRHKLLGEWIAVYQDGQVVRVPASDIEVEPVDGAAESVADCKPSDGYER